MKDSKLHLHSVCEDWKRELKSYREDIRNLKERLGDIVRKNPDRDILAQVDHFENKFNILETHIRNLMHDVKSRDRSLMAEMPARSGNANVKMMETSETIEDQMLLTSRDFYDTRNEYQRFLQIVS